MTSIEVHVDLTSRLQSILSAAGFREPSIRAVSGIIILPGEPTLFVYDPDLSAQEQATFDDALARVRSSMGHLTSAQYAAVRDQMQVLRDFRQLGRSAFMALTAAERDRQLYDAQTATTIVLLAILRD
jgi:hypothetical protein